MIMPIGIVAMITILVIAPGENRLKSIESGVFWQVGKNTTDAVNLGVIDFNGFTQRIVFAEQCRSQ